MKGGVKRQWTAELGQPQTQALDTSGMCMPDCVTVQLAGGIRW